MVAPCQSTHVLCLSNVDLLDSDTVLFNAYCYYFVFLFVFVLSWTILEEYP